MKYLIIPLVLLLTACNTKTIKEVEVVEVRIPIQTECDITIPNKPIEEDLSKYGDTISKVLLLIKENESFKIYSQELRILLEGCVKAK